MSYDPQLPRRIRNAVDDAQQAFWQVIASRFPEAKTGDLSPETTHTLTAACEQAVTEWVDANSGLIDEGDRRAVQQAVEQL